MHKIIESYLKQFVKENDLGDLEESEQFERFVNYCAVWHHAVEAFDLEQITTGEDDAGVDGAAVLLDGDVITTAEDAAKIFKSLAARRSIEVRYVFCQAKRSESFELGEMLKLGTGVSSLFGSNRTFKDDVLAELTAIHDVVVQNVSYVTNGRPTCMLHYACPGAWNENNGLRDRAIVPTNNMLTQLGLFHSVEFQPIDRELLTKFWMRTREPIKATFSVKGTVALPPIKGVTQAYLALSPGKDFVGNVLSDHDGRIRASVFEQNVRAFLGDENPVNHRMRIALESKGRHDRFAINNNGITIVSPDVRVQNDRVSVSDFQIVNGCQTSHVLYRSKAQLTDDIWVSLKIIEAQDPDVVAQLVESTNSQTTVADAQFLSIRPFTQRIESYFNAFDDEEGSDRRIYFERRTNQYVGQNIGKARVYDIPKLARAFSAMFLDIPHIAYMFPTQVIQDRLSQLFRPDHKEHPYYSAALALYRLELAFGNNYVPRKYQGYKWHILMVLKHLLAGAKMPLFSESKIENYCKPIDKAMEKGGRASAPPFIEALEIVQSVGEATRDRRKGSRYTDELLKEVKIRVGREKK